MYGRPLLYLLALCTVVVAVAKETKEQRKLHRLVGGHMRIVNPSPDDEEFLTASASGARDKKQQKNDDEERKTLSQQVADGKYGLIQKELFTKPPKRPGIISYEDNPEVPKDNINNLGGLTKSDIWLAENHLLVLRGGTYPPHDDKNDYPQSVWPAIDDYKAPQRQVKLPAHPKVPPPFPVQLYEGGPLQILGTNFTRTLNGTTDAFGLPPPYPEGGYEPGTGPFYPQEPITYPDQANIAPGQVAQRVPPTPPGEYEGGAPYPPQSGFPPSLNGTLPPYFASLPPGAVVLPPPSNQTDPFDEDDPSIYYPPPYSFYYPKDNSSLVPAGPLVPGIILPPPPNFFAPLDEETKTTKKPQRTRKPTTARPATQIYPTTTPVTPTPITTSKTTRRPQKLQPVYVPEINNELKPIVTTTPIPKKQKVVTVLPVRQQNRTSYIAPPRRPTLPPKRPKVTILRPVKPATPPQKIYVYNNNNVQGKPFAEYGPPPPVKQKTVISTTQVPLKIYYSTANEIDTNSVTQLPEKIRIRLQQISPPKSTTKKPAQQYYYYEEEPQPNSVTTPRPYFDIPKEYYVQAKPSTPNQQQQQQYIYVTSKPYNTPRPKYRFVQQTPRDTFSIHIAKLQKQIHQYYTTQKPNNYRQQNVPQSRPVYQYSFQAANYQQPNDFRPSIRDSQSEDKFRPLPKYSVQIQQAIEVIPPTEAPRYQSSESPVYYRQNYHSTTESPRSYYSSSSARPDYDYEDPVTPSKQFVQQIATPRPISQYSFEVTPNPIYQGYYTKPDEGYFDDITKKYFTSFGKKLPSATTPLSRIVEQVTPSPNVYNPPPPEYVEQKPVSLQSDTLVNYVNPRPNINPEAEIINNQRVNYPQVAKYVPRPSDSYVQRPVQSNRQQGPEIIKAIPVEVPPEDNGPGSFISYQLPGDDGAHFYFLTPQLAQRRDQGAGYFYDAQPNGQARIRRNQQNKRNPNR